MEDRWVVLAVLGVSCSSTIFCRPSSEFPERPSDSAPDPVPKYDSCRLRAVKLEQPSAQAAANDLLHGRNLRIGLSGMNNFLYYVWLRICILASYAVLKHLSDLTMPLGPCQSASHDGIVPLVRNITRALISMGIKILTPVLFHWIKSLFTESQLT